MRIRIATVHNPTREEETSSSSDDDHSSNEESINDETTVYNPQANTTDIDQTPNTIQIPTRLILPRNRLLTTLRSWILLDRTPRIIPLPIPTITCNSGNPVPQSNYYLQQLLEAKTSNNHWGTLYQPPNQWIPFDYCPKMWTRYQPQLTTSHGRQHPMQSQKPKPTP